MSLFRWFTQNVADTSVPTHADLEPLTLPGALAEVDVMIRNRVGAANNWSVEPDSTDTLLHLTRTTGVLKFVDDVTLSLDESGGSVAVNARSQSRKGKGDLGQNRRNILELFSMLRGGRGES